MKMVEIRKIARNMKVPNYGSMRKIDLVRAIQQKEGNPMCYATGQREKCTQVSICCWAEDCR